MHKSIILTVLSIFFLSVPVESQWYAGMASWTNSTGVGACGTYYNYSDFAVALPPQLYNNGSHCGQVVNITRAVTWNFAVAGVVRDVCSDCSNGSLVLSLALFEQFDPPEMGIISIFWDLISG